MTKSNTSNLSPKKLTKKIILSKRNIKLKKIPFWNISKLLKNWIMKSKHKKWMFFFGDKSWKKEIHYLKWCWMNFFPTNNSCSLSFNLLTAVNIRMSLFSMMTQSIWEWSTFIHWGATTWLSSRKLKNLKEILMNTCFLFMTRKIKKKK